MKELVHVEGRRVTYSRGVGQFAAALSPLGLAANIVAEAAACLTELRQLQIEEQKIEAMRQWALEFIETRRREIGVALQVLRTESVSSSATASELRGALGIATRMMASPHISDDERRLAQSTIQILSTQLINLHTLGANAMTSTIDIILNGDGAIARNYLPPVE